MDRKISLIIPLKDEEKTVGALLDSILGQSRIPDEIVITDAGSKDRTADIINEYMLKGAPIKLVRTLFAYPGTARNLAIEASSFDFVAMTDGGISLDASWLKELEAVLDEEPDTDVVYGNYKPRADSLFKECLAYVFVAPSRMIKGIRARSHFIASSLIKKDVWRKVGGFPAFRASEDRSFMKEIENLKLKIGFAPRAVALWDIPSNLAASFRRFSTYSMHDLAAGRFRDWHWPVIKMYLIGAVVFLLGIFWSSLWFVALAIGIFARAIGLIYEKSEDPARSIFDIKKLILTAVLMLWVDMAMFCGVLRYIKKRVYGQSISDET